MSDVPDAETPELKLIPKEVLDKIAEQDDIVKAIVEDRAAKVDQFVDQVAPKLTPEEVAAAPSEDEIVSEILKAPDEEVSKEIAGVLGELAAKADAEPTEEENAAARAADERQAAEDKSIQERLQKLRDEDAEIAILMAKVNDPYVEAAVPGVKQEVTPEEALETLNQLDNMDAALADLESALEKAPLEEGVVRAEEPPEVEFSESLGFILFEGKSFAVCQPLKAAEKPEDPLFLVIEQTQGVSLRDSEKLLVFDWGLVRLRDRVKVSDNGKRMLAAIQAVI